MTDFWSERPARPADAALVAAHGCYRPEDRHRCSDYATWVQPRLEAGRYLGLFAVVEDVVIAGAGIVLLDWGPTRSNPSGQMGRVVNVFTEEPFRRKGIARSLLSDLMSRCEALGVREFNLGATTDGRPLYQSLGFVDYAAEMRRRAP
ncbi:Acetyltransferase (GNAT) domain-containing protein [Roseateles sp. YR242]|uniref:GNAT family N-acetyltransferase n=1 Tax=Roseateles sp. YR242 TaxID=1855305 RepID=UPI0008BF8EAF|nr:GNAT family N-acetyltransferase [Roseateles sp. YR242]SEL26792.1 Acetyltransferase (GNAT) domain-containing protein [Roseateles sp. YR242]